MIALFFALLVLWVFLSIIFWSIKNGITPTPTSLKVKPLLLDLIQKQTIHGISKGSIYELGAGWGTLAFPLAAMYPDLSVEAYESSTIPYLFCKIRLWITPKPNLHLHRYDFFKISLNNASLVVCYLYPQAMQDLKIKFEKELLAGCIVVSNTFAIPGWSPIQTLEAPDLYHTKLYLYKIEKNNTG